MNEFDTSKIRDEGFREKFSQKLAEIQAVREKNTFLEYAVNQRLFLELESIYRENLEKYRENYLKHREQVASYRSDYESFAKKIHPLRLNKVDRLLEEIETALEPKDYSKNQQAGELLSALEIHLQKSREEYTGWEENLAKWRMRLKEVMTRVWSEDYADLKAHYQEAKQTLTSDRMPPDPLQPDETKIEKLIHKRASAFEQVKRRAARSPKLRKKVEEIDNTFYPEADFNKLKEEVHSALKKRLLRLTAAILILGSLTGIGIWKLPGMFMGMKEDQAWEQATNRNTLESYEDYIAWYPSGKYVAQAYDSLEKVPSGKLEDLVDNQGVQFDYEGELSALQPDGLGKAEYENGARYEGYWSMGFRDSVGTYATATDDVYEGEWKKGIREGKGTLTFADGSSYTGGWKNDVYHGQGKLTQSNGNTYEGGWKNGLQDGKGTFRFGENGEYSGGFSLGKYHGTGTLKDTSGITYTGQWQNGVREGQGRQVWPDGREFVGHWKSDVEHGEGVLTWTNGGQFSGIWVNGLIDGLGTFVGRIREYSYSGYWKGRVDSLSLLDDQGKIFKQGRLEGGLFMEE